MGEGTQKITIEEVKKLFPLKDSDYRMVPSISKSQVFEKLVGKVLFKEDSGDYQGTELFIIEGPALYIGSYGSCDYCDWWSGPEDYVDLTGKINTLLEEIHWGNKNYIIKEIKIAMDGSNSWHIDDVNMFEQAIEFMENYK